MNRSSDMKAGRTTSHPGFLLIAGLIVFSGLALAQQNAAQPQPQADKLPPPGTGSPKLSQTTPRPEGAMPQVPAGFTVTSYADIDAPRMMVYAPNGDLFVSSPAANSITVFRDANNDGVFEERSVYAAGAPPARRGGGGGFGAPGGGPGAGPGARAGAAPGGAANAGAPAAPAPAATQAPAAPTAGGAAPAPGGAGQAQAGAGAPGGQRRGGGAGAGGAGGVGGRGAPSILGANAPACAMPPAFAQPGPGVVQAPFGLAF